MEEGRKGGREEGRKGGREEGRKGGMKFCTHVSRIATTGAWGTAKKWAAEHILFC
jgi:hypothetical protein